MRELTLEFACFQGGRGSLRRMLRVVAPWTPATLPELARRLYRLD